MVLKQCTRRLHQRLGMDAIKAELARLQQQGSQGDGRKVWKKSMPLPAASQALAPPAPEAQKAPLALPTDETTQHLRATGQPVRLFGETEAQRRIRAGLSPLESPGGEEVLGGSKKRPRETEGDSAQQQHKLVTGAPTGDNVVKVNSENELGASCGGDGVGGGAGGGGGGEGGCGGESAEAAKGGGGSAPSLQRLQRKRSHLDALPFAPRQTAGDSHKYLYKFWNGLLSEWEEALSRRPAEVSGSAQGRMEEKSVSATRDRPLWLHSRWKYWHRLTGTSCCWP